MLTKRNLCGCPEVLIVDDVPFNRVIVSGLIESLFNLGCEEASNGREAID